MTMRAPTLSEPKSNLIIFPTYQVPQESAMRGSAPHHEPPVQPHQQDDEKIIARTSRGDRADPPSRPQTGDGGRPRERAPPTATLSVISGSGRGPAIAAPTDYREASAPNLKLQSVTDNCLLNSVTVPKIQRNGRDTVAHNNYLTNNDSNNNVDRDKDDGDDDDDGSSKFGALPLGRDIPNQKSDDLEVLDASEKQRLRCDNNDDDDSNLKRTVVQQHGDYDLCHKQMNLRTIDDDDATQGLSAPLRLRGGGESSLSTGTSGWGTPPSQQANNNNMNTTAGWGAGNPNQQNGAGSQQWNNNANRPPGSSQNDANKTNAGGPQPPAAQQSNSAGGWGQAGGAKPPPPPQGTNGPPAAAPGAAVPPANNNAQNNPQNNNTNTTKQQLEQLNNMREAIYSTEGWGGHVNQDSQWDLPASPEPAIKMDGSGPPPWKPAVNNGTELWEANLRNGGQPPPQPQQKTPWGHTPSTNIGGTWGEDDDTAESSNVWTGVPNNQQQGWNNNSNTMWGDSNKRVAGAAGNNASGWGDPRAPADPRAAAAAAAAMEMRPDLRAAAAASGLDPRQLDPREQIRQMTGGDMRGDPRGITGRLNGAGAEFWGQTGPHVGPGAMHHQNKMPVGPGNAGGWEEPSPPTQRRAVANYDDGTSLWGNPQQGAGGAMGGGRPRGGPPGMAPGGRKPEGVWGGGGGGAGGGGGGGRNGWDDVGGPTGGGGGGGWGDEPGAPWAKPKGPGGGLWDSELDWGHKPQNKPQLSKEQVWNSKQFRMLVDMGFKKEDVENALRMREMNMEEALELLSPLRRGGGDGWGPGGPHDDHFEHNQFPGAAQRFAGLGGPGGNPLAGGGYPPGPGLLNSMGGGAGQPNSSLINSISPAVVQKILSTQQPGGQNVGGFVGSAGGGRPMQPQNQPSTQQLRMLVQQIQMAVQAGYLNHQILNQPLAPQTLVLLNQLLQQIKTLHQLQQQMALQSSKGNANNPTLVQISVLVTKTKQQIINIQNQIQAQQAHYVKQQQQQQGHLGVGGFDFNKSNPMQDSINALQSNFGDLGLNKDPTQQSQSRLNQWINKDKDENSEFSRAPGSSSKPVATSPNMAPIGLTQPDGPWSSGRSGDTGWPDSSGADTTNDVKEAQWGAAAQPSLTDLVPEFEPGKPWKGNQIKSIEDDPSITPGSVVRSPLSIATINVKDNELFGINSSKSPPATDAMQSLSSSTWTFNPPSTSSAFTSPQIKLPTTKGSLGDLNPGTAVTSELWGAPKSRGPPPGLSGKGGGGGGASLVNGWAGPLGGGGAAPWCGSTNVGQRNSGNWGGSTGGTSQWLLLRNLTAQIDGSTLRTLCMQHGPLLSFHLHLHQGFALAKYSSREEATKAQTALNNCVLGNTTILAENPTDWEANTLLQNIASQQGANSGGWRSSSTKPVGGDTWSTGWSNNPSSLWATTPLDSSDPARATPSSLNSFLPNDLLGGESM